MSDGSPFPLRPAVGDQESAPRVVNLDDEAADRVIDALSSETARAIYAALREAPATPPELAERVDCSLQTVHYHLGSLEDASLVESAGTGYSEKGVEMTVYAPADRPLVLTTAEADTESRLRRFLGRILGAGGGLAVASLVVQFLLDRADDSAVPTDPGGNATAPIGGSGGAGGAFPPGVIFFAGGALALLLVAGVWYWSVAQSE